MDYSLGDLGHETRVGGSSSHADKQVNAEQRGLQVSTTVFAANNAEDLNKASCDVILDTVRCVIVQQ